jgi:hypothetical protein
MKRALILILLALLSGCPVQPQPEQEQWQEFDFSKFY